MTWQLWHAVVFLMDKSWHPSTSNMVIEIQEDWTAMWADHCPLKNVPTVWHNACTGLMRLYLLQPPCWAKSVCSSDLSLPSNDWHNCIDEYLAANCHDSCAEKCLNGCMVLVASFFRRTCDVSHIFGALVPISKCFAGIPVADQYIFSEDGKEICALKIDGSRRVFLLDCRLGMRLHLTYYGRSLFDLKTWVQKTASSWEEESSLLSATVACSVYRFVDMTSAISSDIYIVSSKGQYLAVQLFV